MSVLAVVWVFLLLCFRCVYDCVGILVGLWVSLLLAKFLTVLLYELVYQYTKLLSGDFKIETFEMFCICYKWLS